MMAAAANLRNNHDNKKKKTRLVPLLIASLPIPFIVLYFYARLQTFFSPGYTPLDITISVVLFSCDLFFMIHTASYLANFVRSTQFYESTVERYFKRYTSPTVSVIIASYNEPPEVIEKTLSAAVVSARYAGGDRVYLLDDSTVESIRSELERLARQYGAKYVHRTARRGFKAGAMNDALPQMTTKYFTVLDADQRPLPEYLAETVSILEDDQELAFVQVPQRYTNTDASRLALGAHYVQLVFFDYITEGKSCTNSMFSCGSNTVFRTDAVREVGGFDETSVTEDMATSIKIHEAGWHSKYYNKPLVDGEGPTTLGAYFTQQARWSLGSMGLCLRVVKHMFTKPRSMTLAQWWDYFVTTTWYFVGWINLFMLFGVLAFVYLSITPIITTTSPDYFLFLLPYILFNMSAFTLSTIYRGHEPKSVLLNIALTYITTPIYVVSAILVFLNKKRPFKVTPKNFSGGKLPLSSLYAQLLLLAAIAGGIALSIYKSFATGNLVYLVSTGWLSYYAVLTMFVFYFNTDARRSESYDATLKAWQQQQTQV